ADRVRGIHLARAIPRREHALRFQPPRLRAECLRRRSGGVGGAFQDAGRRPARRLARGVPVRPGHARRRAARRAARGGEDASLPRPGLALRGAPQGDLQGPPARGERMARRPRAARWRRRAPQQPARRFRPEQRHPRRRQPRREARTRVAQRGRRGAARPLCAPASRGLHRSGPGHVDPQQAPARGARPRGPARAHGRAGRHRERPGTGSGVPARELDDLGAAEKRGHRMKLCRYDDQRVGLVQDGAVLDVTPVLEELGGFGYPLPRFDPFIASLDRLRPKIEFLAKNAKPIPLDRVKLLAPVANPGKIIAAPVNYAKHLQEALADKGIHHGNLVNEIHKAGMFLKATSAVVGPGEGVKLVHTDRRNDHELALVIGRTAKNVNAAAALDCIAGYCIGLDMTIRGPEERSLRKSPDSYCVLGPWLATPDEVGDPGSLQVSIAVNGEPRQDASTSDLILGVAELIAWGSSFYTLHPGDVILTGTPQGVGPVKPGDTMHARIERIGSMQVKVS